MKNRSFSAKAIVIKRKNFGESDRLLTLLSSEQGKFVTIAKGVRKMPSSKRAYLEPGNIIQAYVIVTKSIPLLTQLKIISDLSNTRYSLSNIKDLMQILEIFDQLFVEEEIDSETFIVVDQIMTEISQPLISKIKIKKLLFSLLQRLGFADQSDQSKSISEIISELTNRKMKSFDYLTVKN